MDDQTNPTEPAETTQQPETPPETPIETPQVPTEPKLGSAPKHQKGARATVAIIVAVLVSLILIGVGYMAYQSDTEEVDTSQETSDATEPANVEAEPVDATELQESTEEIDSLVEELDENSDFAEDSLSDDSLGL